MPVSSIEVRRAYSDDGALAMIEALHSALRSAFRIPDQDKHIRFVEHRPTRFIVPDACRSVDAKRHLYREIVTRFAALGVPEDHITVIVRDIPTESWGISGGYAASDLELGFEINV